MTNDKKGLRPATVPLTRPAVAQLPDGLWGEISIDLFAGGGGFSTGFELATGRCVDEAVNHDPEAIAMHAANHRMTGHHQESVRAIDPHAVARGRPVAWLHASPDCTHFSSAKGGTPVKKEIRGLAWCVLDWVAALRPRVLSLENVREFQGWGPIRHRRVGRGKYMWDVRRATDFVRRPACAKATGKGRKPEAGPKRRNRGKKPDRETVVGPHKDDGSARGFVGALAGLGYTVEPMQYPDKRRSGETFEVWVGQLRALGYDVDWRVLDAADYGAPTHRRRLFLVARRDGVPIRWPEKTHGAPEVVQRPVREVRRDRERDVVAQGEDRAAGGPPEGVPSGGKRGRQVVRRLPELRPFRPVAECLDFSTPCRSIFDRPKPHADNTQRRIAKGIQRFVIEASNPFLIQVNHAGEEFRGQRLIDPLPTISAKHGYGLVTPLDLPLIAPHLSHFNGAKGDEPRGGRADEPLNTIPASNRFGLVSPCVVRSAHGEACADGRPRWGSGSHSAGSPLPSLTASKDFNVAGAFLAQIGNANGNGLYARPVTRPIGTLVSKQFDLLAMPHLYANVMNGGWPGHRADRPAATITRVHNKLQLVTSLAVPFVVRHRFGETGWADVARPLQTVCAQGNHFGVAVPLAVKFFGTGICKPADVPLDTTTSRARFGLCTASLMANTTNNVGGPATAPLGTITTANRHFVTTGFLAKHYGNGVTGHGFDRPIGTITAVDHHGPVTAWGTKMHGTSYGFSVSDASPTITGGGNHLYLNHAKLCPTSDPAINEGFWRVYAFLRKWLGDDAPLPIVTVNGVRYLIYDIGMRMLSPRELLNAQFGPELAKDYVLTGTNESQVAKIGNSVPPALGAAVVRANWGPVPEAVAA